MTTSEPKTIKGYELRERIGAGGFGEVYRAHQPVIEREVAIKFILPQFANQPDFIRRFETEAQLVARLEHPHIVPLFDYWRDPDGAYLVLRWLRGGSLRAALDKHHRYTVDETARLLDQIAAALMVAHRAGIVHRDIKPDNILLDDEGNAYLTDFGIAQVAGHDTEDESISGSIAYMSPDQLRSEPPSPQMDIYSLGIILYEMLTGRHPFDGDNPSQMIMRHLNDPMPQLRRLDKELPEALEIVIARATAKIPQERFADARSMALAFYQAITPHAEKDTVEIPTVGSENVVNPYKGLRPFGEADAADFFGRDALIDEMLLRLTADDRFLAVIGPSGSGKSSAVMAGLIPALRRGALPGSDRWFVVTLVPGDQPLQKLSAALLSVAVTPPTHLLDQLKADPHGLLWVVDNMLANTDGDLVLVIDQFEEVFTLLESESERTHFLELLRQAATAEKSRLHIIVTLRADFYDRPLLYEGFGSLVQGHTQVVLPLSAEEIERAISGPAKRVGLQVEGDFINAVVSEVQEEPGALPLLQYALTEVFERREGLKLTLKGYEDSGGVLGALAKRAEEAFGELTTDQQNYTRQVFLRLVTLGEGTEDTRRRVRRAELTSIAPDAKVLNAVLDLYGRYRLLTFDVEAGSRQPTVEVAHEALIRGWGRLRSWLDGARNDVRLQRLLAGAAGEWEQSKREKSFLLSGARLAQYQDWIGTTDLALTGEEKAYLSASTAEHERQLAFEEARRAREAALEKRSQRILRALVGVFLLATVGAVFLSLFAFNERQISENNAATATIAQGEALIQVVTSERLASESQSLAMSAGVEDAIRANQPDVGVALALQANLIPNAPIEARRSLVSAASASWMRYRFSGHTDGVNSVAYSPDGSTIVSGSADKSLIIWNATTGEIINKLEVHTGAVLSVVYSPDGSLIASGSADQTIILWDAATGQIVRQLPGHTAKVNGVAFSPDGKMLASASTDKIVILWDVATGTEIRRFEGHTADVNTVAFSPDSKTLVSGSNDKSAILWDIETGEQLHVMAAHTNSVFAVAFSPNGATIATGARDQTLILWDAQTGTQIRTLTGHTSPVYSVMFTPDGSSLVSAAGDQTVVIWDAQTGDLIRRMTGHRAEVMGLAVNPNGLQAVSVSRDRTLIVWDIYMYGLVRRYRGLTDVIYALRFSADGQRVLAGTCNLFEGRTCKQGRVVYWDFNTGEVLGEMLGHKELPAALAFSPDETMVLSGGLDGTVILFNLATGEQIRAFEGHTAAVRSVAFSQDGLTAVTASDDKTIILWDVATGEIIRKFTGHTDAVHSVAFSPDGTQILSGSADTTLILWDVATGDIVRTFRGHTGTVHNVLFNADGTKAISGSYDSTMILWDVVTGEQLVRYKGHTSGVSSMALSADGNSLITGSFDRSLILWDVASGAPLRRFQRHTATIQTVTFQPGSNTVAISGAADLNMIVWNIEPYPGGIVTWLENNRTFPELTCDQRQTYRVEPRCDADSAFPSRTPYPDLLPTNTPGQAATATLIPPSSTPTPTATVPPTATPEATAEATAEATVGS